MIESENYWTDKYKELDTELTYWKEQAWYWEDVAAELEGHNKELKELLKSVDK